MKKGQQILNSNDGVDSIYNEYGQFIESVICFAAKDKDDRDDIYQEVFVALLRKGSLQDVRDIKSYLYQTTMHKAAEYQQRKARREKRLRQYFQHSGADVSQQADQDVLIGDQFASVLKMLENHLSNKELEAVRLRYAEKLDNEEAACKMNVHRTTFIRYVSVGLKKIRDIIRSRQGAEE